MVEHTAAAAAAEAISRHYSKTRRWAGRRIWWGAYFDDDFTYRLPQGGLSFGIGPAQNLSFFFFRGKMMQREHALFLAFGPAMTV